MQIIDNHVTLELEKTIYVNPMCVAISFFGTDNV